MWVKSNLPPHIVAIMNARCGCEGILSKICWVSAKILIWNLFVSWENEGESIWSHLVFLASWVTLETEIMTHGSREWYWWVYLLSWSFLLLNEFTSLSLLLRCGSSKSLVELLLHSVGWVITLKFKWRLLS